VTTLLRLLEDRRGGGSLDDNLLDVQIAREPVEELVEHALVLSPALRVQIV